MPVHILGPAAPTTIALPFFSFCVPAGFPSPAQDHMEGSISLDELIQISSILLVRYAICARLVAITAEVFSARDVFPLQTLALTLTVISY